MTFEKHLRSVFRAASYRLGILRKFWLVFYDRSLLMRCFRIFVLPALEYCSAVWCTSLTAGPCCQWCPLSNWGCVWVWHCSSSICSSTVYAVKDQVQSDAPSIWSSLHVQYVPVRVTSLVLWSHIGILMRLLVAGPHSTAGPLFQSQSPCETIL